MKTKVNKLVKLAAAGLFLIALAINVKVTLEDPFAMLSEDVIAQATTASETTSTYAYEPNRAPKDENCLNLRQEVVGSYTNCVGKGNGCTETDCVKF